MATAITTMVALQKALSAMISGSGVNAKFILSHGGLGAPNIDRLLAGYIDPVTKQLTVSKPTPPTIVGKQVTFSGDITNVLGVTGNANLSFDLDDGGAPSMLIEFRISDEDWRLATSFPAWNDGNAAPLDKVSWTTPVLWFTSIDRPAIGSTPTLKAFVDVTAQGLDLSGVLGALASLPGAPQFTDFSGAVSGPLAAPLMRMSSSKATSTAFGYIDLPLTFSAVSSATNPFVGKNPMTPPPVYTYLSLSSDLKVPGSTSIPSVPVSMDFTSLGSLLTFSADLRAFSKYEISEFSGFVNNAPIGTYLKKYISLANKVELRDLTVQADIKSAKLAAVSLSLGTSEALTVVKDYVEIPTVDVNFAVNDPLGKKAIFASISGDFDFLQSIPVRVTGSYPDMVFTGGLITDTPITIEQIISKFAPGTENVPNVQIDQLMVTANLASKTYGFAFAITSDWTIPVGITSVNLQQAGISLQHTTGKGDFAGEIYATANFYDTSDVLFASFYVDWALPGSFVLKGTFPDIDLKSLATNLTGGYLQSVSGLPEIHLKNTEVQLTIAKSASTQQKIVLPLAAGSTTYDFTAQTQISIDKFGDVDLLFELVGAGKKSGFVVGLLVAPTWTPDSIWSGLEVVFDAIAIDDAGVILSSVDDPTVSLSNFDKLPYVPEKIGKGVTFFSELSLQKKAMKPLGHAFPDGTTLQLSAFVDTSDVKRSTIEAKLSAAQVNNAITWDGMTVTMEPGAGKFTIATSATFAFHNDNLVLAGAGTITIGTVPSAAIGLGVANWKHPFGIEGLDVKAFGMTAQFDEVGVTIGLLGSFQIGTAPSLFTLTLGGSIIDFEVPGALVFDLDASSDRLPLTEVIKQFTTLDLSKVPLLNGLAFKTLDFYAVDDPSGWIGPPPDSHHYPMGIGLNADLFFYEYELKLAAQVEKSVGIIASGSLNKKIDLLGILVLSDETGKTGPSASINTSSLASGPITEEVVLAGSPEYLASVAPHARAIRPINPLTILSNYDQEPYFAFSGGIDLMGLESIRFSGSATDEGFEVNFDAALAKIFTAHFAAAYSKSSGLVGDASGHFDFQHTFSDGLSILGIKIVPDGTTINGPNAALNIGVIVNSSKGALTLALSFHWASISFDLNFTLDAVQIAGLLKDLFAHIVNWIEHNVEAFLHDILKDIKSFISWVAAEGKALAVDVIKVAEMLYNWFKQTDIIELAQNLIEASIYGLFDMAKALVHVFDVSMAEALKVLEQLMSSICEVEKTQALIYAK